MPREISDEEYNDLIAAKAVRDLVNPLWNSEKFGPAAKRLIKEAYPDARIPDLELSDKIDTAVAKVRKERDDEKEAERKAKQNEKWAKDRAKAMADYGFTDEGMKEVEKFMVDNGVANYDVAASHLASKRPRPSDPTAGGDNFYWNHGQSELAKEVAKDPEGWARKEFMTAIRKDEDAARAMR